MKFSHFFIERPIFACVLSMLITLAGAIAAFQQAQDLRNGDRASELMIERCKQAMLSPVKPAWT